VGFSISEELGDMPGDDMGAAPPLQKAALVARLLAAKEASGKTFSQIAEEVGLTNVYCTQLFYNQVRRWSPVVQYCRLTTDMDH
jgi:cyanate lyase